MCKTDVCSSSSVVYAPQPQLLLPDIFKHLQPSQNVTPCSTMIVFLLGEFKHPMFNALTLGCRKCNKYQYIQPQPQDSGGCKPHCWHIITSFKSSLQFCRTAATSQLQLLRGHAVCSTARVLVQRCCRELVVQPVPQAVQTAAVQKRVHSVGAVTWVAAAMHLV